MTRNADPVLILSILMSGSNLETAHDHRLCWLVTERAAMDDAEASDLARAGGLDLPEPFRGEARPFHHQLATVINQYGLAGLFSMDGPGQHHHVLRPRGYDFFLEAVDAFGMEQWRADYRGMAPSRQMMAATIVWLYRGGKDNRWLRRVPCTWSVAEGFRELNAAGAFDDWLRLVVLYPGW